VTIIADAAPLIAVMDLDDHRRLAVRPFVVDLSADVVIPAPITAEIDYLVGQRIGRAARRAFLTDLADGKFRVETLTQSEYHLISSWTSATPTWMSGWRTYRLSCSRGGSGPDAS